MRTKLLFRIPVLAGLALVGLAPASHASLMLRVVEAGTTLLTAEDNVANDINPLVGQVTIDPAVINALTSFYKFSALGSTSNALSTTGAGVLTQNAEVTRTTTGGTPTLEVIATDNSYPTLGAGTTGTLTDSASTTFTNAVAGNTRTFQGFFDPDNTLFAETVPDALIVHTASGVPLESFSTDTPGTDVGPVDSPYALTNHSILNISASEPGTPRTVGFSGTTRLVPNAVPEPSTMALAGLAGVFGLIGLRRRNRKASV